MYSKAFQGKAAWLCQSDSTLMFSLCMTHSFRNVVDCFRSDNGRKSTSADNRLQIAAQLLLKFDGCHTTLKVLRKLATKEAFKNHFVSDKYVNLCKAKRERLEQMAYQLCLSHNH